MSNTWFCSDLHIGDSNIGKFRGPSIGLHSDQENRESFKKEWLSTINKRDTVYFLGDIIFDREALDWFIENIPR